MALPQLSGRPMVTDGGMETDLIFHHGVDLPLFAAFPLVDSPEGRSLLTAYRIRGVRYNASTRSHAELDEAEDLDEGDLGLLADRHRQLAGHLPALAIVGGCCGTDARHVDALWN